MLLESSDHLLAEAWLEAVASFQTDYLGALDAGDAAGAARHVVAWSRQHPDRAALLTAFRLTDLLGSAWPAEVADRASSASRALARAVSACSRKLAVPREVLLAAAVDLPYGLVRRKLYDGGLSIDDETLVHSAATAILRTAG